MYRGTHENIKENQKEAEIGQLFRRTLGHLLGLLSSVLHISPFISAHALGHQTKDQKPRQYKIHCVMDAPVKAHKKGHQDGAHGHACIAT